MKSYKQIAFTEDYALPQKYDFIAADLKPFLDGDLPKEEIVIEQIYAAYRLGFYKGTKYGSKYGKLIPGKAK